MKPENCENCVNFDFCYQDLFNYFWGNETQRCPYYFERNGKTANIKDDKDEDN